MEYVANPCIRERYEVVLKEKLTLEEAITIASQMESAREPNKARVVESHPLPHMDELLATLPGSTVFFYN